MGVRLQPPLLILLLLSAIWEAMTQEQIHMNRQNRIGYPREDLYV